MNFQNAVFGIEPNKAVMHAYGRKLSGKSASGHTVYTDPH